MTLNTGAMAAGNSALLSQEYIEFCKIVLKYKIVI